MMAAGEQLAELLRTGLAAAGITQAELARRAGITRAYAGRLVAGSQAAPTAEVVARLATALELGATDRPRLFLAAGSAPPELAPLLARPVVTRLLAWLVAATPDQRARLEAALTALLDLAEAAPTADVRNPHSTQVVTAR